MTLFALCILSSSYTSTIVGGLEVLDYGNAASNFLRMLTVVASGKMMCNFFHLISFAVGNFVMTAA
ncbi:MAG TPA: hypothetical protein DHV38_07850 [Corynebacterium casei]|nr:hypothetical protein [Corynebacterium casei]